MVALVKEPARPGPGRSRSESAGGEGLLSVLVDALLPAELTMVKMGDQQRVRESRMYLQVATADEFITTVEDIVGRKVRAFSSATDPDHNTVFEVFTFEPDPSSDGHGPRRP